MNSFRVMNTRFRILKGGKIGLAFSIALIGGMLILSSTKANATDYFTGTSTTTSMLVDGITVQTATNIKTNGTNADTKSTTSNDDVIFAPTSWANSYYIVPSTVSDYYGTGLNAYSLNQNPEYLKLELTFASGANANNITKQGALIYTAPTSPSYVSVSSSSTYSLTPTPSSIDYTANLIFQGNNTVSGYTGIGDGNIKVNGNNVVFNGIVTAGSIDVGTTGTGTFNSNVNITSLNMTGAGTAILNSNLTGNVIATGDNQGILTTTGANQTITGNIGSSTSLDLGILNIGSDTVSTNYSKTTINGDVFANSTVLNNNGTTNSSELIMASGKNITSTITTADANMGILTLAGGIQTVAGKVGDSTNKLAEVNAGNGTTNFTNDVYATNLDVEGTGTVNLNGNYTGTALRYNEDGIVNLSDAKNINSAITSDAPNQGTLNLAGTSTVTGQVGDATNKLKEINANGIAGKTVTFANDVYATNTNIGAGTVNIKGNLTGAVNSISTGTGTLTTTGATNQTITGAVGDIGNLNVSNTGSTTVAGDVNAVNTKIDSTLIMTDGSNVTSTIAGTGNLTLDGNSTVTGTVGNLTTSLGSINANGASDKTVTFANDVYATNTNIGAGTVDLKGNLVGTVTPKVAGTGILKTSGTKDQTITGTVGNIGNLNVSNTGFTTTVAGDVNAVNTKIDSTLIMTDGSNVTSTITGTGNLTLDGNSTVTGTVGASGVGNSLGSINAGTTGKTVIFANDVYATNTNIGAGTVDIKGNLTGAVAGTGILKTSGTKDQTITGAVGNIGNLNVSNTGFTTTVAGDVNAVNTKIDSTLIMTDGSNVTSTITGAGNLTLNGSSTVTGTVGASGVGNSLGNINANGASDKTVTFANDVYATNTNIGAGTVILNSNLTGNVVATGDNQGILTTTGANQTITGNIGSSTSLDLGILNIGSDTVPGNYSKTTINGDVFANSTVLNNNNNDNSDGTTNSSELILASGKNIISTITTADANMGILTLAGGTQTVSGTVGSSGAGNSLANVKSGANSSNSTFVNDVYANTVENTGTGATAFQDNVISTNVNVNAGTSTFQDNLTATTTTISTGTGNFNTISGTTTSDLQFTGNGTANLNTGLTGNVTTTADNKGTLNLVGNNTQTVSGTVGDSTNKLAEINTGTGITNFTNDVYATNTKIGAGAVNFAALGTTNTNIIFTDNGIANLLNGLTGDINFSGKDATINVSDGKGILGSVQTLALNNTGIINYQGDGTLSGNSISSGASGIKELNINTNNEQNSGGTGLVIGYTAVARELYADVINLRNNATLTLKDNTNLINTGSDNILITVDTTNTGTLTFEGTSNIKGEVGQSNNVLNTINAGATAGTVTFDDMVYASTLKYSDNGKVVLNGDNSSNASSEGMIGTVDFDNKAGTLAIGDDVNLTVGAAGTQFINGNDAILEFAGSSIITGILGGNTAGNSTFKEIHAGADGETVTFKNDVYVKESTFHVSGEGAVNFQGNLIGSLIYDDDGVVNVSDGKNIVVSSSVPVAVTTATSDTGSLNFLGTTTLYTDIGTSTKRLKNVTFGTASSYTQNLDKNIYAQNTYVGNGTNQTILEMNDDIIFGGSLTVRANSALDVSTHDITVTDNLALAANSLTRFKIYTSDITASGSSVGVPSGSITTDTLTIDDNAIIKVNYVGTLYGAGSYNLISTNTGITGTYYGTEANGKVTDNSIIDSIIKVDGNNLILFADRTGAGKYGVEDLYIVKSGIGEHYSNGASQALAGYAYDTLVREGALGDIVTKIEELDGGLYLTSEKKAQMVEIQKLLAPVANNSSIQSSLTASTLVSSTIKDRMSDMRFSSSTDFIPYSGYSSGTYTLNNSLWIKAMGSKATQSKVEDYDGYNSTTLGFVAGIDRTLRSGSTIGLALAHANTKINQTDFRSGDSADTQSIQFSTYGSMDFDDTYVDGILSYARHDTDSTRTANSGKLSSSSTADQISAKVEVGHRVYFEDVATLTPFVSVEYGNLNQKGYTEKGTAYQNDALKVDSVKVNKGTLGAGAKLSTNLNIGDTVIVPEFKLAAYNAFGDTNADIKAQYVGGGNQFVTPTQDLNKTMFNAGLGVKTTLSESTSLMIGVDYDRSKDGNFQGYSGNVSFRLNF